MFRELWIPDKNWKVTPEYLLQPHIVGVLCAMIALLIATGFFISNLAPIEVKKSKSKANSKRPSVDPVIIMKSLFNEGLCESWNKFWRKIPRRCWNFYIEAFLIPRYRNEWGKYKVWSYRSPERQGHRSSLVQYEINKARKRKKALESLQTREIPVPIAHNHHECQKIRININGLIYETQLRTLNKFPDTLLGDPERRIQYYDAVSNAYYFDRNRTSFESMLYFYQSGGRFRRPEDIHLDVFLDDAEFYQIPEAAIQAFRLEEGLDKDVAATELPDHLWLKKIWLLFDFPESSAQARIVAIISVVSVVLSIAIFCVETLPDFKGDKHVVKVKGQYKVTNFHPLDLADPMFFVETVCSMWFTIEFGFRFLSAPKKSSFLRGVLNVIDLVSIIPYFLTIATVKGSEGDGKSAKASLSILRVIRLVRVFRIFKLSRHSKGLKILGRTLHASLSELFLLVFFVFIGIILFSSTMFFAEQGELTTKFTSIPEGFWWAVITMTTVGYGDVVPKTPGGKIVGSLCAIAGVLTIALPVPVIVSNFNFFYHQAIDEQVFNWTKINHVSVCPYRPGGYGPKKIQVDEETAEGEEPEEEEEVDEYSEPDSDEFQELEFEHRPKKKNTKPALYNILRGSR